MVTSSYLKRLKQNSLRYVESQPHYVQCIDKFRYQRDLLILCEVFSFLFLVVRFLLNGPRFCKRKKNETRKKETFAAIYFKRSFPS